MDSLSSPLQADGVFPLVNKPLRMRQLLVSSSMCFVLMFCPIIAQATTPREWVWLGQRVHGGFGTYIALGIRIGLDAMRQLQAKPRELNVLYQDGPNSPCPCVVDGIMLATVTTPGQNSLHVLPTKSGDPRVFGVVTIKHTKTGLALRYVIPDSARLLLDAWNRNKTEFERYQVVMNAQQDSLFRVERCSNPAMQPHSTQTKSRF